jgi:chromosome segregation ATPase
MTHPDPEQDGKGELKDCPFCGSGPWESPDESDRATCYQCGYNISWKKWNTRYQPLLAQKDAEIEELVLKNANLFIENERLNKLCAIAKRFVVDPEELEKEAERLNNDIKVYCEAIDNLTDTIIELEKEIERLKEQVGAARDAILAFGQYHLHETRENRAKLKKAANAYRAALSTPTDNTKTKEEKEV